MVETFQGFFFVFPETYLVETKLTIINNHVKSKTFQLKISFLSNSFPLEFTRTTLFTVLYNEYISRILIESKYPHIGVMLKCLGIDTRIVVMAGNVIRLMLISQSNYLMPWQASGQNALYWQHSQQSTNKVSYINMYEAETKWLPLSIKHFQVFL